MAVSVTQAMILAAGLGVRMRPLTDSLPKPLIEVRGRTLIDRALDRLIAAGVRQVVVNSHYLGDKLEAHLAARTDIAIAISRETALLETGGAIVNALPLLANLPFFVVNADSFWTDGTVSSLERLAAAFDPVRMDALLMLHRTTTAFGYDGAGDYFADPLGRVQRRREGQVAPYAYAGVHILTKMAVAEEKLEYFSLVRVWDRLQDAERLYGQIHDGLWFHVATPKDLMETEEYCRTRRLFS